MTLVLRDDPVTPEPEPGRRGAETHGAIPSAVPSETEFAWTRMRSSAAQLLTWFLIAIPAPLFAQSNQEQIEPTPKQLEVLQALTPDSVARGVVVHDDDLEPIATLTTENAYQSNGRFTDRVRADNMVRAFITKETGQTRYQFYQRVTYAYAWRDFDAVTYATPGGLRSAPLVGIEHKLRSCTYGFCSFEEIVGFDVDEPDLRAIAATYSPGKSPFWRVRFKASSGFDWNDRMMPAEVAGLLLAVDAYQHAHPTRR